MLRFVRPDHPLNQVRSDLLVRLEQAQANLVELAFPSAADLCAVACREVGVPDALSSAVAKQPVLPFADWPRAEILRFLQTPAARSGFSQASVALVADRIQLLRAFERPDDVVEMVRQRVEEVVTGFPKSASDLEQGANPGDVLDPFILAATSDLMYAGEIEGGIEASVSHKAMMMIEGLIGHLHEEVIGAMRGNVRVPEPRGEDQEILDPVRNPFPGADLVQPPLREQRARFHQVKSKTGSAKGGDGARLGQQLLQLEKVYKAETYYDALIGKTLRGHRSMAGVLRQSPRTVVLVGEAAFRVLTRSSSGAELLLRVYQRAFQDVAHSTGYSIRQIAAAIALEFRRRASEGGADFLNVVLRDVTQGDPAEQDSSTFKRGRRGRRGRRP